MGGLLAACVHALVCASVVQAPVGVGNALTLPAQRHVLRMTPGGGPAIWLLALQQDGADDHGLSFFRSDDEAGSFQYLADIQADWSERDEADLIAVGDDVALTYSYEGPELAGSSRHDVYFQWWRYDAGARTWRPQPPVLVFDSNSNSIAYSRAEIARDSAGRIWIQAFRLEADGSSSAAIAVSEDGGASFRALPDLDNVTNRGGGRLLWLGDRVIFVYAMHDGFQGTHFRIHFDWDAPGTWQPVTLAFSEGMYHGAALSAVATPEGGMHLVYKDENDEKLYYRFFDGSSFGPRTQLDDSSDWALQPALTLVGDSLYIFYNHFFSATDYDFRYRVLQGGDLSGAVVLDDQQNFKGYPASAEVLPTSLSEIPAWFGATPNANIGGDLTEVLAPHDASEPPPDAGPPPPPPDAGPPPPPPDAGAPPTSGVLFSDNFNRTGADAAGLGASWSWSGLWYAQNEAISDLDGADLALETVIRCGDCQVQASVDGFGVPHTGLVLRATSAAGGNRYQLDLLGNGHVQLQRVTGSGTTVLADAPSGIADLSASAVLALSATGSGPVQLTAQVNGRVVASATDASGSAIGGAGYAGLFTGNAGVWFDDFELSGLASSGGPPDAGPPDAGPVDAGPVDAGPVDAGPVDAGPVDAGPVDAGPVDAGVPDAGPPDAGPPDAGPPDAGPVDAGVPDAGVPDAGPAADVLFSDEFNRTGTDADALGSSWAIKGRWYADQQAIADRDANDVATEIAASCADCQVSAQVTGNGVPQTAIFLRGVGTGATSRYQLNLRANGHVQIQRIVSGGSTVLVNVASGLTDLSAPATLSLSASGSGPVKLIATVNGRTVATTTDSSSAALTAAGYAGLYTRNSGVRFDHFVLSTLETDGGSPPDAGSPDAGPPDAGTPDAGPPDAGTPDAGPPDAGTPYAGAADAGSPVTGVLFQDAFNRTGGDSAALGPNWTISGLWYTGQEAISDLDGTDLASENVARCGDCQVSALATGFGVSHTAIFLRAPTTSASARYQLDLIANGHVQIQRVTAGGVTVLADVASGISDPSAPATLALSAVGAGPVSLTAFVNGHAVASATDSSGAALTGAGYAGLYTTNAGVWWDDFTLSGTTGGGSVPDAGSTTDAGSGSTDAGSGSGTLALSVAYTDTTHRILAVDPSGTAYAATLDDGTTVFASSDGRSWSARGGDSGGYFSQMTALGDGTLLADVTRDGTHRIARSTDGAASWTEVLDLGSYRTLTSHSWAELDGEVFLIEYQDFTTGDATLRLWVSDDDGGSWSIRQTFTGHRHGHGLAADPAHHALWVFFGDTDAQSGIYRSTDAGNSFTLMLSAQPGDVVDATVLADGSILFGQDISYLPPTPHIATLSPSGSYRELAAITGPSYAIHALRGGGYVVGAEREPGGDIYAPGEVSAHLYTSADGQHWTRALDYPRLDANENARADVYWELPSGELLLELEDIQGFGIDGKGYQVLHVSR